MPGTTLGGGPTGYKTDKSFLFGIYILLEEGKK